MLQGWWSQEETEAGGGRPMIVYAMMEHTVSLKGFIMNKTHRFYLVILEEFKCVLNIS